MKQVVITGDAVIIATYNEKSIVNFFSTILFTINVITFLLTTQENSPCNRG